MRNKELVSDVFIVMVTNNFYPKLSYKAIAIRNKNSQIGMVDVNNTIMDEIVDGWVVIRTYRSVNNEIRRYDYGPSDPDLYRYTMISDTILPPQIDYSIQSVKFKALSNATSRASFNMKKIAALARIDKRVNFHSSRHTWATRALRKGMRIEYVSKLLGHSSIKTTQIYAKIENQELDGAMEIFN